MAKFGKRLFATVAASDNETLDYTPANGEKIYITKFSGCGIHGPDVKVEVIWDADGNPEILFATHGTIDEHLDGLELVGNGSKKLRIKLTNDSASSETIGACWCGEQYGG